jgi:hypothetical protein
VGDTGVQQQYAGTILSGQYQGSSSANGTVNTFGNVSTPSMSGTSSGTITTTATPIYRYRRQTNFNARLLEASTGRNLWATVQARPARSSPYLMTCRPRASSVHRANHSYDSGRVKPSVETRILESRANGDRILKTGRKLGVGTSGCSAWWRRHDQCGVRHGHGHLAALLSCGLGTASEAGNFPSRPTDDRLAQCAIGG